MVALDCKDLILKILGSTEFEALLGVLKDTVYLIRSFPFGP